jgi:5'-nucleotidase
VSGHTHAAYNCLINNAAGLPVRVTSGGQYARNLTDIDLTIDTRTRDVIAVAANNRRHRHNDCGRCFADRPGGAL